MKAYGLATKNQKLFSVQSSNDPYSAFKKLDGSHPLKEAVPDGYVDYQVRTRHGGRVFYFNFELAKEMGLIPQDHPERLTPGLSKALLDTFALQIINEYDIKNKTRIPKEDIRPGTYMATRYLQLQHPSKKGKTSGDGRGMWNGCVKHKGVTWDVSSQGTGATRLSPATAIEKKFFKTGDKKVCYGDGYADIEDGLSAALMSEIFHKNGIPTERTLAVIEFPGKKAINVRASKCLLRPAHFFCHLKQSNHASLKGAVDLFIDRQIANGDWPHLRGDKERYEHFAKQMALTFSKMVADFETNYVFCWLDWDGDNILANGGIIDYGSVRQFGAYHHLYRYDDVDRFSTRIPEQRIKARYIVQTCAQIRDYLLTGKKKNINAFRKDSALKLFDQNFIRVRDNNLLHKMGFNRAQRDYLLEKHGKLIDDFRKQFSYFERAKCKRGTYWTADGLTCDAVFTMRDVLRELPRLYLNGELPVEEDSFIDIARSSDAQKRDLVLTKSRRARIRLFQTTYLALINEVAREFKNSHTNKVLLELTMRASIINRPDRITGDGMIVVTDQLLRRKRSLSPDQMYRILADLINYQVLQPDNEDAKPVDTTKPVRNPIKKTFLRTVELIREYRETI